MPRSPSGERNKQKHKNNKQASLESDESRLVHIEPARPDRQTDAYVFNPSTKQWISKTISELLGEGDALLDYLEPKSPEDILDSLRLAIG